MKKFAMTLIPVTLFISSCAINDRGTLAQLRDVDMELKDTRVDGGLEKAMAAYQNFLEKTPESAMTPEAIRRLADLNVEKEYGAISGSAAPEKSKTELAAPEKITPAAGALATVTDKDDRKARPKSTTVMSESDREFEKRATAQQAIKTAKNDETTALPDGTSLEQLETAGARKAIKLYLKLLEKYPLYERNDQVLYQLSRAYEETGQLEQAMDISHRLVREYPKSRHFDEVQFRRAEFFFTRKKYIDAEDAYKSILLMGVSSSYYELAVYKQGWTFFKQDMYEEAVVQFITLLDHKVKIGYDFEQTSDKVEKKRIDDTYHAISLGFSYLGGADAVVEFFDKYGKRSYESSVYEHLGEFYLSKRRYSDAALSYKAFVSRNPFNKASPHFNMRIIDIYKKGGFPRLVIEAKKDFASTYGIKAQYWKHFDIKLYGRVVDYLKTNITDLANYYHSAFQNRRFADKRQENFSEASHWYKEFLDSFPKDTLSPGINYQLADLLLENNDFQGAAIEYEKTAYDYPRNKKSSIAGYAAVYAYREHLKRVSQYQVAASKREVVRVSLRFVDVFPEHEKAAIVLGAAIDDLYEMRDFPLAIKSGHQLVEKFPQADKSVRRSAWLVIAYSSFEIKKFKDSEQAYISVLGLSDANDPKRNELLDNLAASVYKQGEEALVAADHRAAADHFLRIARLAPSSKIRPTAEYDAAAALIHIKDWKRSAEVLKDFRENYPKHELQTEITRKIAYVYNEDGKYKLAAIEYERVEREAGKNDDLRRESLLIAAELYEKTSDTDNALRIYRTYVGYFPKPVEFALETQSKIAEIYKTRKDRDSYLKVLNYIISADANAGAERSDRTRYLAAVASLTITEPVYDDFVAIKLVMPFKKNLNLKKSRMKENISKYNKLVEYGVGHVTAAATYYIAETYYNFSRSLMESERPGKLSELELEQYNLLLEEQAYPFEEKAISVHKKNLELLTVGVYSPWIDRSLHKLGSLFPGRYAKYEESTGIIETMMSFSYESQEAIDSQKEIRLAAEKARAMQISKTEQEKAKNPDGKAGPDTPAQTDTGPATGDSPTQNQGESEQSTSVPSDVQAADETLIENTEKEAAAGTDPTEPAAETGADEQAVQPAGQGDAGAKSTGTTDSGQ